MAHCTNFSLIAWKQTAPRTVIMSRLRCKSWTCPYCNKKNREMWSSFLKKKLPRVSAVWWFVTITAHESFRMAANSIENLRKGINHLMKRLRRIYGRISYVRVYEVHQKGAFHAHMLVAGISERVQKCVGKNRQERFTPTDEAKGRGNWSIRTFLRRTCRQLGMGYMVDSQRLESHIQAVRYVVKYLSKDGQAFEYKGLRRVQTSQDIGSPKPRGEGGWKPDGHVWRQDIPESGHLVDLNQKMVVPDEWWLSHDVYPVDDA